jgi:hypothetical protein
LCLNAQVDQTNIKTNQDAIKSPHNYNSNWFW